MADLTNLIAAGPPRWDTEFFSRIFDQAQRGRDDQFTNRNRDLWKDGVPMKGDEPDWGRAMLELMRAGGSQSVPNAVNLSGLQTLNEPSLLGPSGGQVGAQQGGGGTANAIASIESGGRYDALGPVTKNGVRGVGKYQVLEPNIGPWTKEVLGREMTSEEFRQNPQAQDAVAKHKISQFERETGSPQKAALMWFTGRSDDGALGLKDQLGTSGAGYLQKFAQNGGGGGQASQGNLMPGLVPSQWVGRELEYARALMRRAEQLDARKPGSGKASEETARAIMRSFEQNADEERKRESTRQKENLERGSEAEKTLYPRADESKKKADAAANDQRAIFEARQLLDDGIFSGFSSDPQLTLSKIGAALNIPSQKAVNTETFKKAVAARVLEVVKGLGSGAGISNADREFAEKMAGGDIKFEEGSLRKILDIGEKANRITMRKHKTFLDKAGGASSAFKGVMSTYETEDPGEYRAPEKKPQAPQPVRAAVPPQGAAQAAPAQRGGISEGATATHPQTGQKAVRRGGKWVDPDTGAEIGKKPAVKPYVPSNTGASLAGAQFAENLSDRTSEQKVKRWRRQLENAESDDKLRQIKREMEQNGFDTDAIPQLREIG